MRLSAVRNGMALVAVLAVVSLIAILAIATLSVTTRLEQGSSLAARDARLEAATSYALSTVFLEWRQQSFSTLNVGGSRRIDVPITGDILANVNVTRLGPEVFWLVAEGIAGDLSRRHENLLVRLLRPRTDSLSAMAVGGDVSISRSFQVVPDTVSGCAPSTADLTVSNGASVTSVDGPLPTLRIARDPASVDTAHLFVVSGVKATAISMLADVVLGPGTSSAATAGLVHATGDLTLTGGAGSGVLIVDGKLTIAGPVAFAGVIIAKGGVVSTAGGGDVKGLLRAGTVEGTSQSIQIQQPFTMRPSACTAQVALAAALMPRLVVGRPWAEMY